MAEIVLTNGDVTHVDDIDLDRVVGNGLRWSRHNLGYAQRSFGRRTTLLHRFIMNPPPGMVIDHIDHDKLNNRRSNLRVVTSSMNSHNYSGAFANGSSGYLGVSYCAKPRKWRAQMMIRGVVFYAGMHDTPESAAAARRALELAHADEIGLLVKA